MGNSKQNDLIEMSANVYLFIRRYFKWLIPLFLIFLSFNIAVYFITFKNYSFTATIQSNDVFYEIFQQEIKVLDDAIQAHDYLTVSNLLDLPPATCKSFKKFSLNKLSKETTSLSQLTVKLKDTSQLQNLSQAVSNYLNKIAYNSGCINESKIAIEKLIEKSDVKLAELDKVHSGIASTIKGANNSGSTFIMDGVFNEYFQMYQNKLNFEKQLKIGTGFVFVQSQFTKTELISFPLYIVISVLFAIVFALFTIVVIDFLIKVKKFSAAKKIKS